MNDSRRAGRREGRHDSDDVPAAAQRRGRAGIVEGDSSGLPAEFVDTTANLPGAPSPGDRQADRAVEEAEMPVKRGKDGDGPYYQWGDSGKRYHYESGNKSSRESAKQKAEKQGRAARASGYDG